MGIGPLLREEYGISGPDTCSASYDVGQDAAIVGTGGPENPGCEHGTTVGGYGSIGVGLPGVFQWNPEEFQGGYEFGTGHDFSEGPAPGPVTFGSPGHFELGGSVGIQVIGR